MASQEKKLVQESVEMSTKEATVQNLESNDPQETISKENSLSVEGRQLPSWMLKNNHVKIDDVQENPTEDPTEDTKQTQSQANSTAGGTSPTNDTSLGSIAHSPLHNAVT